MTGVEKKCLHCGNSFVVPLYREKTARYCSKPCQGDSWRGGPPIAIPCVVCGNIHRRCPSHMDVAKPTCSLRCRGIAYRSEKPTTQDYSSVRKWMARRGLIKNCERCEYNEHPEILIVHHRDRDRRNNDLTNLEILCPNCHALEHASESINGFFHKSTRRKRGKDAASQRL